MPGSKPFFDDGTLVVLLRPKGVPFGFLGVWADRASSALFGFIFCHAVKMFAFSWAASAGFAPGLCAVGGARKFLLVNLSAPVAPVAYVEWCCGGGGRCGEG
jgi:hypothetical protein